MRSKCLLMFDLKKILNVQQTREADNYTIQHLPIASLALMENAAMAFVKAFEKHDIASKKISIVCGAGNNGGDGLAVCRLLQNKGINATAVLVKFKDTLSKDCQANADRLKDVVVVDSNTKIPDFNDCDIIIDAVFGSGLNSAVKGFPANMIEAINKGNKEVYAIDVPSGLFCETISESGSIIKNAHVICFQRPKLSFFYPENSPYIKTWEVVDIGLDEAFIQSQTSKHYILDEQVPTLVKDRPRQSHKGTYGHALLMAGSYGKIGAATLAAKACLRSGVGLLTTYVPICGYNIMQISVPEAMCLTDDNERVISKTPDLNPYNAIGVGPGIGTDALTVEMLKSLLTNIKQPLVLDADAINILSANPNLLDLLPSNTILTPHIKEFDRLVGNSNNTAERHQKQQAFCKKHHCIIVLKDANTCIVSPEGNLFFNTSGNQGMATGGSGDVLTGIITSLLAQKYNPLTAAIIGVYFHGKAGDLAVENRSYSSLIASDIVENLNIES